MVSCIDENTVQNIFNGVDVLKAIYWIRDAWNEVSIICIEKCFSRSFDLQPSQVTQVASISSSSSSSSSSANTHVVSLHAAYCPATPPLSLDLLEVIKDVSDMLTLLNLNDETNCFADDQIEVHEHPSNPNWENDILNPNLDDDTLDPETSVEDTEFNISLSEAVGAVEVI